MSFCRCVLADVREPFLFCFLSRAATAVQTPNIRLLGNIEKFPEMPPVVRFTLPVVEKCVNENHPGQGGGRFPCSFQQLSGNIQRVKLRFCMQLPHEAVFVVDRVIVVLTRTYDIIRNTTVEVGHGLGFGCGVIVERLYLIWLVSQCVAGK